MTAQQVLEFPATRNGDPDTSREAAKTVHTAGRLEAAIIDAHHNHPEGLTDHELCVLLPDWYPPTVVSARSRLTRGRTPQLADSGRRRMSKRPGATNTTRKTVWQLKGAG